MASSVPSSSSQRAKQRAATRERLYQAAIDEFRRSGFANAQIDAIAKAAGVVRGTFYFHFPSKDHVLLEMESRFSQQVADHLRPLRDQDFDLEMLLGRLCEGLEQVADSLEESELLRDMLAVYVRVAIDDEFQETPRPLPDEMVELFGLLGERGHLRDDLEPEQLAGLLLASLFGVMLSRARAVEGAGLEVEWLMRILERGMRP